MKEGDIIYCKKTYINDGHIWVTKNKYYTIIPDSDFLFCIIDDEGDENIVILTEYFNETFYSEKELRKQKLKKLYENR